MKRKKRLIKLIFIVFISIIIFIIYNKTNHHNINYTVIGDSLSLGVNSYGIVEYGYSDYIKDYLKEKNKLKLYNKENTSKTATITSIYNDIITNKNEIKILIRDSDIITMTIGLNDLLYRITIEDNIDNKLLDEIYKEIEINYNNLIKEIIKYNPKKIYIIGYYTTNIKNKYETEKINRLNNILKNNNNVIYINTSIISKNSTKYLSNNNSYYPNHLGYKEISKKIIEKLDKKLEN